MSLLGSFVDLLGNFVLMTGVMGYHISSRGDVRRGTQFDCYGMNLYFLGESARGAVRATSDGFAAAFAGADADAVV